MSTEHESKNRPSLEEIMQQRHADWETLPEARRGQLLVEWFQELLQTEHGQRLREALRLHDEKMYPTNAIDKDDLIYVRPDLEETIEGLSDDQMKGIAFKVGEIIQDDFWSAVGDVLSRTFDEDTDETE